MQKEEKIDIVKRALEGMRPYLREDGGDIFFVELTDDDVLKIMYSEACNDCKFKEKTKFIVEKQIRKFYPNLKKMIEVKDSYL